MSETAPAARAEHRLLLACASVEPAAAARAALEEPIDAELALALARRHGLVTLLAEAVEAAGDPRHAELAASLAADRRRIAYANLHLAGELVELARGLEAAEVDFVAYKGPTLAVLAYGSLVRRRYRDLDLLVRPRDFERARAVLLARGYRAHEDEWRAIRHLSHEVPFERDGGRSIVDLHRRVLSRELFPGDAEPLWRRLAPVRVGEHPVPSFAVEDLLRILVEHAHKHRWERLGWLADVAHLVAARPALDWDALEERARAAGGARVLAIGLLLAAERLAAPVPAAVLARLADSRARALADELGPRLVEREPADEVALDRELVRLQWLGRERLRDRLRLLATPNESDWIAWPLPAPLAPLHYLLRPLRVALKYRPKRAARAAPAGRAG
jgi:hypothetical protein